MSVFYQPKDFDVRLDVVPVAFARPILIPPRSFNDPAHRPLFVYRSPHTGEFKLIDEEITIWPFTAADDGGLPVVLRLGQAIFAGRHLLKPDKQDRLLIVVGKVYEDDLKFGFGSRWVETRAVSGAYQPPHAKPVRLFVSGERSRPATKKATTPIKPAEPVA